MSVFDSILCRLCAESKQITEIIDLTTNAQTRMEMIEKLAIFPVNAIDFTNQSLPETVCTTCCDAVRFSYDFYKKIEQSQIVFKDHKNIYSSVVMTYTASSADIYEKEIKLEDIPDHVKEERLSDPFEMDKKCDLAECSIKMEFGGPKDIEDDLSSSFCEAGVLDISDSTDKNDSEQSTEKTTSQYQNDDDFQCTTCGKSFSTWKELVRHTSTDNDHVKKKRTKATIEEKTCDICFKVFDIPAKLRYHKLKHTDRSRDYVCDVCGKAFYAKDSLNTHKIIHNPETVDCKICKKTFISMIRLRKHLKTHDMSKPFECNDCQRTFRTKYQLGKHMAVHSDVFPYSCEYCKKGFRFKNVLKTHENIHTGAKPFVCTVCGMDFTNWSNCNKHMVRKHSKSLAKRVKTAHGMMPINQETLKPKEVDMESVKWSEQMSKPRKRGRKKQQESGPVN